MKFLLPFLGAAGYVLTAAHAFDRSPSGNVGLAVGAFIATVVVVTLLGMTAYKTTARRWLGAPALLIPPGVALLVQTLVWRYAPDHRSLADVISTGVFGVWVHLSPYQLILIATHVGVLAWMFEAVSGPHAADPVASLRRAPRRVPGVILAGVAVWLAQVPLGALGHLLGGDSFDATRSTLALRAALWSVLVVFTFPLALLLARSNRVGGFREALSAIGKGTRHVLASGAVLLVASGWVVPQLDHYPADGPIPVVFPYFSGWMQWIGSYGRHPGLESLAMLILSNFAFVVVTDLADRLSPHRWEETF